MRWAMVPVRGESEGDASEGVTVKMSANVKPESSLKFNFRVTR